MINKYLIDYIQDQRDKSLKIVSKIHIYKELLNENIEADFEQIQRSAEALELAVLDMIMENPGEKSSKEEKDTTEAILKSCAADAFRLFRVLPPLNSPIQRSIQHLRMCTLAVIGDKWVDASRFLREKDWSDLPIHSEKWDERTWSTILDVWFRLIRKKGWEDRDLILENIAKLRDSQNTFEKEYLSSKAPSEAKKAALELVCLYHLSKAAEILALFMTDGVVNKNFQIRQLIEAQFDRIFAVCNLTQLIEIEPLARLLFSCSLQMINNSIWTVTRAVNTRVTDFVRYLVDRGRGDRALFDVLPPQRRTLAEKGLLGSSRRAIVVSLPTSSGKTLIAEFRILQALNQFEFEKGWVAYIVPTKVLVNQITRQLRTDFSSLNIIVEKISPALEIDNTEAELLLQKDNDQAFRVLVSTPEKLDLMLRQGWEKKIGRPLTLVVVDEAHNIQNPKRGLKLELLLSTINIECQKAQFLLLTPFISNAGEIATWLGGNESDDISLSLDWQPNDRMIGIVNAEKGVTLTKHSWDYHLKLETIHTTRKTLEIENKLDLDKNQEIAQTFCEASKQISLAALVAQNIKRRGPVIVMHQRPDWVWSLAEKLKIESNRSTPESSDIKLVQDYLRLEFGDDFALIDLLKYRIGVHHAGLSDEIRVLMEWLFEKNELNFLIATTTIAQGVNFPVSGVVMASHQYPYGEDMPPEDFWNIAGRAGRINQEKLGIVALVANNNEKVEKLKEFINKQSGSLNSALINLTVDTQDMLSSLEKIVFYYPEWSTFLQYLTHTYRQIGETDEFIAQIEQILRGTLGYEKLRQQNHALAIKLLDGILAYAEYLKKPGQPLKLVDSTGFSLQSIKEVLNNKGTINHLSWDSDKLFQIADPSLKDMMGVLLNVPELREGFKSVTGGRVPDGQKLALIIKDWVNGSTIPEIAGKFFADGSSSKTTAITKCCQNLFGALSQTVSWGLGALLSITCGGMPEEELSKLNNLPSKVYYGVKSDAAITLRLLGIPRSAAEPLAETIKHEINQPITSIRKQLRELPENSWTKALGDAGATYHKVWQIIEGYE